MKRFLPIGNHEYLHNMILLLHGKRNTLFVKIYKQAYHAKDIRWNYTLFETSGHSPP